MKRAGAMKTPTCVAALLVAGLAIAVPARAQSRPDAAILSQLQQLLDPGDAIFVIDRQGRETKGTLKRLSSSALVVDAFGGEREIPLGDVGRIERPGSGWAAALVGAALVTPAFMGAAGASCSPDCAGVVTKVGLAGGLAGAFVGASVARRTGGRSLVYSAEKGPASGPVHAFADLWARVKSGDTVYVIDVNGREATGVFQKISDSSIDVLVNGQSLQIRQSDVRQVARRGDSLKNGALWGAGLGAIGAAGQSTGCSHYASGHCPSAGSRALWISYRALVYGAIGAGIDALHTGRTTVYEPTAHRSVQVTPLLSTQSTGLFVSVRFQ